MKFSAVAVVAMMASGAAAAPCVCKNKWTYDIDGCREKQKGCPLTSCDGYGPEWTFCVVTDKDCDDAEVENGVWWAYCEPDAAAIANTKPCECKAEWTYSGYAEGSCGSTQYGCPADEGCEGGADRWCLVTEDCSVGYEEDGLWWSYCNDNTQVEN